MANMSWSPASRTATVAAILIQVGCGGSRSDLPTAPSSIALPTPTASSTATLRATVVERDTGTCLEGALVEVVSGQRAGQTFIQETPCDGREDRGGVTIADLTAGVPMRLRVSATGWRTQETTIAPHGLYRAVFAMSPQGD